jgi:hypothetical protein
MDIIKKFHSAITHKSAMLKFFMIGSRVGKMIIELGVIIIFAVAAVLRYLDNKKP